MLRIQPLSLKYIHQAISLLEDVFPNHSPRSSLYLGASLDKHELYNLNRYSPDIKALEYYIALDTDTNKVLGLVGLYEDETDGSNIIWLSFFCVHPNFRRQKIGTKLFEYSIQKAKVKQKTYLRIPLASQTPYSTDLFFKYSFEPFYNSLQKILK